MVRDYSALRYVVVWGRWYCTNCPLVGGTSCFSMGRVRSGWLSKFWCVPVLFQWVFGLLNGLNITGSHLLDAQQLESSVDELQLECSQTSLVRVPLGCYNGHNVLAGSNIFIWVCSVRLVVFLNPKPK